MHLVCIDYGDVSALQNLSKPTVQLRFKKMLQCLAVTFPKNDRMDPHGVYPILSIFLPTPSPMAMQGTEAATP